MANVAERWYHVGLVRFATMLLVLLGGGSALVAAGCAAPAFQERLLARIPDDARVLVPVSFSHDGRRAAYAEQHAGSHQWVCGSRKGKPYESLC